MKTELRAAQIQFWGELDDLFKALPPGARRITVRPNALAPMVTRAALAKFIVNFYNLYKNRRAACT
jgi:hypothetical protein